MLKKNLLSIAVVTAAMSLAACNDTETVADPAATDATTEEAVVEPAVGTAPVAEADPVVDPMAETDTVGTQTIAELAAGNENLTILTAALQAAGLDTMLMEDTKYTVFAPTDDAFAPVLEKLGVTKEELLANTELLKKVLPYHVVAMEVKAADIPYGTDIETANGATISISDANVITDATGGTANITGTDIMATNGVVHTIDAVLMPE
ncbi:fasciclin domain-containing protein [Psychrobacter sp. AOP22-C1-C5]|uniref:fasciclin domain-containing protein n=1 Tax=Psychrobacter sp. AOP22-C1-C5 TaxID=3457716 RepID=UPI00403502BF